MATFTVEQSEDVYGIDLSFDATQGIQEVIPGPSETDFAYARDPALLAEELQRLFDLTPKGSLVDDPTYGINWDMIGTAITDVRIKMELVRLAVYEALSHPSFKYRFRIIEILTEYNAETPNAIYVTGRLEVFGENYLMQFVQPIPVEGLA